MSSDSIYWLLYRNAENTYESMQQHMCMEQRMSIIIETA